MNERIRVLRVRILALRGSFSQNSETQQIIDFLEELIDILEEELDS